MGAAIGTTAATRARQQEVRDIYDRSALLPLFGADRRDKVVQYARLKQVPANCATNSSTSHSSRVTSKLRPHTRFAPHASPKEALLVFHGALDVFQNNVCVLTIVVRSRSHSYSHNANNRSRDHTGAGGDSNNSPRGNTGAAAAYAYAVDPSPTSATARYASLPSGRTQHNTVTHSDEVLVYWRRAHDVVCRYSSVTGGDEILLKCALGQRVELHACTQYVTLALKCLVTHPSTSSSSSINALTNADLVDVVGAIPFFHNIPRDQLVELTELSSIRVYPAGSVIFTEEQGASTQMFVTLAGSLEVSSARAGAPLAKLEPGSFFGEMSLLINIPRAATVTAIESCLLMSIEKDAFHVFLARLPTLRDSVYRQLKERLVAKAMLSGVLPFLASVDDERLRQFSHHMTINDTVAKGDCILRDMSLMPVSVSASSPPSSSPPGLPPSTSKPSSCSSSFGLVIYGVLEIVPHELASSKRASISSDAPLVFLTPGCYYGPFTFERLAMPHGRIRARSPAVVLSCPFAVLQELLFEFPQAGAEAHIAWLGERCHLSSILRHAVLTERFQAFLEAEHSDENFTFCLDIDKFRAVPREDRYELAHYIQQRYIQDGAPRQVNLPATIREQVARQLRALLPQDTVPASFFDAASDEIMMLMTKDSFPRFKKSAPFRAIAETLDPHRKTRHGSSSVDTCVAFRDSMDATRTERIASVAVDKLQRMLSTIRRSHVQTAVAVTDASSPSSSRPRPRPPPPLPVPRLPDDIPIK